MWPDYNEAARIIRVTLMPQENLNSKDGRCIVIFPLIGPGGNIRQEINRYISVGLARII